MFYYVATVIKTVGTGGEMSYKSTEQNKNSQVDLEIWLILYECAKVIQ